MLRASFQSSFFFFQTFSQVPHGVTHFPYGNHAASFGVATAVVAAEDKETRKGSRHAKSGGTICGTTKYDSASNHDVLCFYPTWCCEWLFRNTGPIHCASVPAACSSQQDCSRGRQSTKKAKGTVLVKCEHYGLTHVGNSTLGIYRKHPWYLENTRYLFLTGVLLWRDEENGR
jgi:hypothetical protein